jgi:hypothetical protein
MKRKEDIETRMVQEQEQQKSLERTHWTISKPNIPSSSQISEKPK